MPSFGDVSYYYGDPDKFVAWERTRIFRTDDILAASPVWEIISSGIDGDIRDCQCVINPDGTVGAWLLTTTAIWWCADIKAVSPVWSEVLTVETVIASDAVFSEAANEIKAIATSGALPGFCIAATGPADAVIGNDYEHAYWWMSSDYGQSWTKSDMSAYLFSSSGVSRGYWLCNIHAIAIQDTTGDIYAVRAAPRVGSQGSTAVFKSTDLGVNWSQLAVIASPSHDEESAPILVPVGPGEVGFLVRGNQAAADQPNLYITNDDFASVTIQSYPAGYDGVSGNWPPVRVPDEPDSLLVWHKVNSTSVYDLLYSPDNGSNWALLYAGSGTSGITQTSRLCAPISWPPDPEMFALVRANPSSSPIALAVQFTDDFYANVVDKSGNLETLLGTWQSARTSGFFLPKAANLLDASLTTFLRVQAGRQAEFGEAVTPTVALPVSFEYSDGDVDHIAQWDSGTWTPTEIAGQVATFAEFSLRGVLFFELLPLFLAAGFAPMTPSGVGPYLYSGSATPAAAGLPSPYTFRFGGNDASRHQGSMVQVQDAYLRQLTLTFNLNNKVVTFESEWFGSFIDDNDGAGYAPAAVFLPPGLVMVNGLLSVIGVQDAGESGGAFDALTLFECSFMEWQLTLDTGLRPAWAADQNGLTYCGVRHELPSAVFAPHIRTTAANYAVVLTKAQQRRYQELRLVFAGTDREWQLDMTGRWLGKLNAHDRSRNEVVMKPTFQVATPHTQTTTPHLLSWEIEAGWEH